MIITNSRYALVGYSITSYPTRAHGIIVIYHAPFDQGFRHVRASSFSSARTESKSQQIIELMTFALTWCANISVECSVAPTFFFGRSLPFLILSIILNNKKNLYVRNFNYFSYVLFRKGRIGTLIQVCVT